MICIALLRERLLTPNSPEKAASQGTTVKPKGPNNLNFVDSFVIGNSSDILYLILLKKQSQATKVRCLFLHSLESRSLMLPLAKLREFLKNF